LDNVSQLSGPVARISISNYHDKGNFSGFGAKDRAIFDGHQHKIKTEKSRQFKPRMYEKLSAMATYISHASFILITF